MTKSIRFALSPHFFPFFPFNSSSKRLAPYIVWVFPEPDCPYVNIVPFFDSFNAYFKPGWFITCFLKFCNIFDPFYFTSLFYDIIDYNSFLLLKWLTFIRNDMSLSNYYPNCPVLIPNIIEQFTLKEIEHSWIFRSCWFASLYLQHYWQKLVKFNLTWTIKVDS